MFFTGLYLDLQVLLLLLLMHIKYLVVRCLEREVCGGFSDRMKAMLFYIMWLQMRKEPGQISNGYVGWNPKSNITADHDLFEDVFRILFQPWKERYITNLVN